MAATAVATMSRNMWSMACPTLSSRGTARGNASGAADGAEVMAPSMRQKARHVRESTIRPRRAGTRHALTAGREATKRRLPRPSTSVPALRGGGEAGCAAPVAAEGAEEIHGGVEARRADGIDR